MTQENNKTKDKLKSVTKAEFFDFLSKYPRRVHRDTLTICMPEKIQYNDFSLGNWPYSVVAQYDLWGHNPDDPDDIWGKEPKNWMVLND